MNEWSNITVISPAGDIDIASVGSLRAQVDALISDGCLRIVFNCQQVSFIDSSGMAFLLSRSRRLAQRGGLLSLVNTSVSVTRFLQIARLIDVLHVTSAAKLPVPVLRPGALPLWSKSMSVLPGIEHLGYYRHRVVELLSGLRMEDSAQFDTALAVGEALSNAYDHACGAKGCTMTVSAYSDRVVIEICDNGCGFQIAEDEEPCASEERGRGIKLMRMLVDSVEIRRRDNAPGTLVRLVKLLTPAR